MVWRGIEVMEDLGRRLGSYLLCRGALIIVCFIVAGSLSPIAPGKPMSLGFRSGGRTLLGQRSLRWGGAERSIRALIAGAPAPAKPCAPSA